MSTKIIYVHGADWADKQQEFNKWIPYEVSEKRFGEIVSGKIFINPSKTTPKKLVTSSTPYVDETLALATGVFNAYEALKKAFNSEDYDGDYTITDLRHLRDEIAIIREQYEEAGQFPSMEVVAKRYPEISKMLANLQS